MGAENFLWSIRLYLSYMGKPAYYFAWHWSLAALCSGEWDCTGLLKTLSQPTTLWGGGFCWPPCRQLMRVGKVTKLRIMALPNWGTGRYDGTGILQRYASVARSNIESVENLESSMSLGCASECLMKWRSHLTAISLVLKPFSEVSICISGSISGENQSTIIHCPWTTTKVGGGRLPDALITLNIVRERRFSGLRE